MPDIREPYPVKPVWPTRPERRTGKRKPKEQQKKKESDKGRKGPGQDDNPPASGPRIDDYA